MIDHLTLTCAEPPPQALPSAQAWALLLPRPWRCVQPGGYHKSLLRSLPCALMPLALGAGMHAGVVQAQAVTDGARSASELPAVSVTAKGYAASDVETPVASTVLATDDLARKQAHNLGEALRGEPGISVSLDGAQGQNPVIRGLQKDSVVLMVDGMRLNSAQPAGAIASFLSLGLADRVEVVKGPASVLYGTGALGGAINVRLPQARFEPGLQFKANLGFDSASRGASGAAVLNASQGDHALMLVDTSELNFDQSFEALKKVIQDRAK